MGRVVSCRIASYGEYQERGWEHLPKIGIRYVEAPAPKTSQELETLRKRLDRHGLTAATLQGACDITREDVADVLRPQLGFAAKLGVTKLFLSVKRGETPVETAYARLRELGDAAAGHAIAIVLETHPDMFTNGEVGRQTMLGVDHPNVRLNFDTANLYYYNHGVTAEGELAKVIDFVAAVHLKDTNGGYQTWNFPALGQGVVNFPEVVRMLDARGFTGPYTMELEGVGGVKYTEAERLAYVEESVAYLRRIGLVA